MDRKRPKGKKKYLKNISKRKNTEEGEGEGEEDEPNLVKTGFSCKSSNYFIMPLKRRKQMK